MVRDVCTVKSLPMRDNFTRRATGRRCARLRAKVCVKVYVLANVRRDGVQEPSTVRVGPGPLRCLHASVERDHQLQ
eukprot:6191428-Pleurochrysis_carterae.AAC.1